MIILNSESLLLEQDTVTHGTPCGMKHTLCQSLLDGMFREELVEVPCPPHPGSQADPVAGILSIFQKLTELQNVF